MQFFVAVEKKPLIHGGGYVSEDSGSSLLNFFCL